MSKFITNRYTTSIKYNLYIILMLGVFICQTAESNPIENDVLLANVMNYVSYQTFEPTLQQSMLDAKLYTCDTYYGYDSFCFKAAGNTSTYTSNPLQSSKNISLAISYSSTPKIKFGLYITKPFYKQRIEQYVADIISDPLDGIFLLFSPQNYDRHRDNGLQAKLSITRTANEMKYNKNLTNSEITNSKTSLKTIELETAWQYNRNLLLAFRPHAAISYGVMDFSPVKINNINNYTINVESNNFNIAICNVGIKTILDLTNKLSASIDFAAYKALSDNIFKANYTINYLNSNIDFQTQTRSLINKYSFAYNVSVQYNLNTNTEADTLNKQAISMDIYYKSKGTLSTVNMKAFALGYSIGF